MINHKRFPIQNSRGFTLVELMVTIALLGMVIFMAASFVNFSFNLEKKSEAEYDFQASMRQASRVLNNELRNSSVTFTMTEEYFTGSKKEKWDYLGVESKKEIVQYKWNPTTETHDRIVLVSSNPAISYNLTFNQVHPNSKLVGFSLEGINSGDDGKKHIIQSEISAMNSVAVDDGGSPDNPAVAVAYRSDTAPKPEEITTRKDVTMLITLVLDDSGSMDYDMNGRSSGQSGFDRNNIRKNIMKNEAKKLIDKFVALGNIKVAIIPFSSSANNPGAFIDCTVANRDSIKTEIDRLDASGGTNTGDGLRRAYYRINAYNTANSSEEIVNHIILLTDGNPTYYSSMYKNSYTAKTDDGNVSGDYIHGTGQETTANVNLSMNYVDSIGQTLVVGRTVNIRTFVIGFTAVPGGVSRARDIAESSCTSTTNPERKGTYYAAGSDVELESVFQEITSTILQETWHIYGPY